MSAQSGSVPPAPPSGAPNAGAPASRAGRVSNTHGCLTVLVGVGALGLIAFAVTWAAMLVSRALGV
ncbi:MAG TPA: hypothetical protein PLU35_14395 [Phycisphaerales bacterium]|nr:hypothetical protein [Phycisphaerales bacterium]